MAKYEIMLVVNGTLDEKAANTTATELIALLKDAKHLKEVKHGLKTMAYEINKTKQGWYFQINFESNVPAILNEFRRLALINKNVFRHLIINLEKDYGYKAMHNPVKIKRNTNKLKRTEEKAARRQAEYEALEATTGIDTAHE